MKRVVLYVLLGVVGAGLAVAWFLQTFEQRPVPEFTADHGEARYNRFFALQQALRHLGVPAASAASLTSPLRALRPGDLLLLGDDVGRIDAAQAARLAAWVRAGGHLVLAPPRALAMDMPLLGALGVLQPRAGTVGCMDMNALRQVESGSDTTAASWCTRRFHLAAAQVQAGVGDTVDGWLFARVALGRGSVSVLGDLQPLASAGLRSAATQRLAWQVLAPILHEGQVYLVYQLDGPSLLRLLFIRGWPALLALALLLGAWMAMRSQRLGPPVPMPPARRRALLEHVQAVGEFLFRRDGGRCLHRLACEATLARVARRDSFGARLQGEPLYAWLAERSGQEPARVARAFQSPANAAAFRASLAILARL